MKIFKNIPFFNALYVAVVGCLFSLLPAAQTDLIEFKAPNKYYLIGFTVILLICGCWYVYAALKGELEPADVSVVDIRKEALEKIESEAYLVRLRKMILIPRFAKRLWNV